MLVWKDHTDSVYNNATKQFKVLRDFDPLLADVVDRYTEVEKQQSQIIKSYKDSDGEEWLVSYVPFFTSRRYDSTESYKALVLLVFSRLDEANSPLIELQQQIASNLTFVGINSAIAIVVTISIVLGLVYLVVLYITFPLPKLMRVADEIIKMSTASEEDKDFSGILSDPLFALKREDEIGLMIADYYQLLTVLQERSLLNRDQSQYPLNVFQIRDEDRSTPSEGSIKTRTPRPPFDHTWQWFADKMALNLNDDQRAAFAECTQQKEMAAHRSSRVQMASIQETDEQKSNKKRTSKSKIKHNVTHTKRNSKVVPVDFDNLRDEQSVESSSSKTKTLPQLAVLTIQHSSRMRAYSSLQESEDIMKVTSVDSEDSKDSQHKELIQELQ
jgi:hypothetical protein